jgi:hypothetical protein
MPSRNFFRLVHLPPDLGAQLRESVDEAFQSLGGATAELLLHYARQRHHVDMKDLPRGIDELDKALKEMLGTGRRLVVNHCAEILSRRIGKDIQARTDKLSDVFRQVLKVYRSKPSKPEEEVTSLMGDFENEEESLLSQTEIE